MVDRLLGHLGPRRLPRGHVTDVVHQDVDPAELVERYGGHPLDVRPGGDVALDECGLGACLTDPLRRVLGSRGGAAVVHEHVRRALLRGAHRQRGPEARCRRPVTMNVRPSNLRDVAPALIQTIVRPPSMYRTCPVMKLARGEHRNSTGSTTSSSDPNRRAGMRSTSAARLSGLPADTPRQLGVHVARCHRVRGDPMLGVLVGDHPHQLVDRGLGRRVGTVVLVPAAAGDRGEEDRIRPFRCAACR